MSDTTTAAADNFNTAVGAISLCTAVPLLYALFFCWIPSARIKILNSLLRETEEHFRTSMEDGLMATDVGIQRLYTQFWVVKTQVDLVRAEVCKSKNLWTELVGWWTGLSALVKSTCDELTVINKKLAKRSSRERQNRGAGAFCDLLTARLQYQQTFIQNTLSVTAPLGPCPPSRGSIATACRGPSGLPDANHSPATRSPGPRAQANSRRRLLAEFGRYLLESHPAQAQPRYSSMVPISAERRRRGQAPGLMRGMARYLRRKLGQHQRKANKTTEEDVIDVDHTLFTSLHLVSDVEAEWEDVAHVGKIRLVA